MAKKENKMNAKEFAHELEKAASFIRQQQAEIEALKAENKFFKDLMSDVENCGKACTKKVTEKVETN